MRIGPRRTRAWQQAQGTAAPAVGGFGLWGSRAQGNGHTGVRQCRDWWLGSSSGYESGEAAVPPSCARRRGSGLLSDLGSAAAGLKAGAA